MKQLDLTPLFALYLGAGVPPIRPDLMLAVVLIEVRSGRPRPSQWFRDAKENIVVQWAGFGIQPSRTCWYNFADRISPLLEPVECRDASTRSATGRNSSRTHVVGRHRRGRPTPRVIGW